MPILRCQTLFAGLLLMSVPALAVAKATTPKGHTHTGIRHAAKKNSRSTSHLSSVAMPSERATEIQSALIKQGYLSGEPTGTWDSQTVSAMEKLQSDNGWQSKITPDSRALIKLGLGPDTQHEDPQASPK